MKSNMTLCNGGHTLTLEELWCSSPEDMSIFETKSDAEMLIYDSYLPIIQHLLESGINAVVDIGCGSGTQGYLFRAAGIRYVGIERFKENLRFGEICLPDDSIVVKHACWPCDIPELKGISTCISAYALGITGEEYLVPANLTAMKRQFNRMYLISFPFVQALAQEIWGATAQWVRSYEFGNQLLQICERTD